MAAISPDGAVLGTVDDVLMIEGQLDAVVIEVGGLIGLGTKRVGVKVAKLDVLADAYDKHYLRLPLSREELEVQTARAEATAGSSS